MPLALADPRWSELNSSYNGTRDIVAWLTEAYERGRLTDERLGDLINEVQHQGDTSTAMYALAGHLLELARATSPKDALPLLIHAGIIHANSTAPGAVPCPAFLSEEFVASASDGAAMLSPLLPLASDFDTYKWAVAALAGFMGQHPFARFLDGLEFFEDQFHHHLFNGPFPEGN